MYEVRALPFHPCLHATDRNCLMECLYGYPPFVSSSRQQTRQKIIVRLSSLSRLLPHRPAADVVVLLGRRTELEAAPEISVSTARLTRGLVSDLMPQLIRFVLLTHPTSIQPSTSCSASSASLKTAWAPWSLLPGQTLTSFKSAGAALRSHPRSACQRTTAPAKSR
jgi:hypothetical protein